MTVPLLGREREPGSMRPREAELRPDASLRDDRGKGRQQVRFSLTATVNKNKKCLGVVGQRTKALRASLLLAGRALTRR